MILKDTFGEQDLLGQSKYSQKTSLMTRPCDLKLKAAYTNANSSSFSILIQWCGSEVWIRAQECARLHSPQGNLMQVAPDHSEEYQAGGWSEGCTQAVP